MNFRTAFWNRLHSQIAKRSPFCPSRLVTAHAVRKATQSLYDRSLPIYVVTRKVEKKDKNWEEQNCTMSDKIWSLWHQCNGVSPWPPTSGQKKTCLLVWHPQATQSALELPRTLMDFTFSGLLTMMRAELPLLPLLVCFSSQIASSKHGMRGNNLAKVATSNLQEFYQLKYLSQTGVQNAQKQQNDLHGWQDWLSSGASDS